MRRTRYCVAMVLFGLGLAIELVGTALEVLAGFIEPRGGGE